MNILSAEKISKSYSERILLNEISLGIQEGERIGLVGMNGTGKTTLLKVLAGVEKPDQGRITSMNGMRIEYLPQAPEFFENETVLQQVFKGHSPVMKLLRDYEDTLGRLNHASDQASLEERLMLLMQEMDQMDAWSVEKEAKIILTKLGVTDFDARVCTLSGGQRKRVAMASALISPADLLLLDEPTNHIDTDTVDWLERYLLRRRGALLMVTHDRYFLDRVCNRMLELDNGSLYSYPSNYTAYLELKAEREEMVLSADRKRQNLLRRELAWMQRGAKARSTKQKARIQRFEMLQGERSAPAGGEVHLGTGAARLGRKIIELEGVSKGYNGRSILQDFHYTLLRDDRVGIIGANGAGKTTLLKLMATAIQPDAGTVSTGETVKIGFFTQENETVDEETRIIDYIREEAEFITTDEGRVSASQMLERFLFPAHVQWTPVVKLSGGERRRLYLLRILMGAPNVLFLDEPTNDLDIQTLSVLESYLDTFPGAVVVVSHDRYFLDRVTDRLFHLLGEGTIHQMEGNYSDNYERIHALEEYSMEKAEAKENEPLPASLRSSKPEKTVKFTYKEQREYEQIEGRIASLEYELGSVRDAMEDAASSYEQLQALLLQQSKLEKDLEEAVERWVYLSELAETISEQSKRNNE